MPLSLIMTFRNEEENLQANLPVILNIPNQKFELIVVDDFSMDNSLIVLGALKDKYEHLKYSSLSQETWFSVKMAQNIALKAAYYDWVMVVPPSVRKFSSTWLSSIISAINENAEVVVNYSNVAHTGKFYNLLYRAELFFQQLRSFGFIMNGLPYIVSEDNVAFKKNNYFLTGGYRNKVKESYANLELLVNSFIKKKKVRLIFGAGTAVLRSEPVTRLNFYDLLKKEVQIRKYLPLSRRIFISLEEFTRFALVPSAVIVFIFIPVLLLPLALLLSIISLLTMVIIKKAINRLNEHKLFLSSLIYALILPYFKLVYRFYFNRYSRKKKWKGKK